jgi:hypothetical protein
MKYTVTTKNGDIQRCFDCIEYNCSNDIKQTCGRHYIESDILETCLIRLGKECKHYEPCTV